MSAPSIAFVSSGRLFIQLAGQTGKQVASRFAEDVRVRANRAANRNAWKRDGSGARFQQGMRAMLWTRDMEVLDDMPVFVRSLARGRAPGQLLYALQSGPVSGVFSVDARDSAPESTEKRLFHTADFTVVDLGGVHDGYVCCSVHGKRGSHLAVLNDDGSEITELTEGDSVDLAPVWVPGADRQLLFQSAGIAHGQHSELSPYALQKLDIPSGEISTVLSDAACDLRDPRYMPDGTLLCVRAPRARNPSRPTLWAVLADLLLFPLRLLFALMQWLNFFTARYTGKPLTTAGQAKQKGADARQMLVWSNLLRAREEAADDESDADPAAVPRSHELIRRHADGKLEVLARGVGSYDITRDQSIVYTNGRAIYLVDSGGERRELVSEPNITALIALD